MTTTEAAKVRLVRLAALNYRTRDGRYDVRNPYSASGAAHTRTARCNSDWLLIDRESGRIVFRHLSLAVVREHLAARAR